MTMYDWLTHMNINLLANMNMNMNINRKYWDELLDKIEKDMRDEEHAILNDPEKTYGTVYNDSNSILDRVENQQKISNITISIDFK